ncbi:MAG: thiamine phosphate synthase [Opitutaceae bacterium]|nr:thiamine phosphate synthase [Verrucomicrobiales bacterium]
MKALHDCRLYAFVDSAYLQGLNPPEVARQLCDGGADLIQLRAKGLPPAAVALMAAAILPVTQAAGVGLVINDHPEVAREIGAAACHLGQEDFFDAGYKKASQVAGTRGQLMLGLSTHTPTQAERALQASPDYIAIGPVYATGTKPTAKPVTLDYVRWAAAHVSIPWFAIGGINLQTLDAVLRAGATRICVVSAILTAPNIAKACQEFRQRLP